MTSTVRILYVGMRQRQKRITYVVYEPPNSSAQTPERIFDGLNTDSLVALLKGFYFGSRQHVWFVNGVPAEVRRRLQIRTLSLGEKQRALLLRRGHLRVMSTSPWGPIAQENISGNKTVLQ